jgi:hypothetical protein
MKRPLPLFLLVLSGAVSGAAESGAPAVAPVAVAADDFKALKGQSPFLRSLNLSDSLVLTGFAEVENERVATIMNRETKQTYVVSSQVNSQGWKMVELKADADLETAAVKVAVEGGEVVTVRYAEIALKPGEARPAPGPSTEPSGGTTALVARGRGFGGPGGPDGRRYGGPPPEIREKMEKLSEDQRRKLFEKMGELRAKNPDMSWEERGRIFNETMDKMLNKK